MPPGTVVHALASLPFLEPVSVALGEWTKAIKKAAMAELQGWGAALSPALLFSFCLHLRHVFSQPGTKCSWYTKSPSALHLHAVLPYIANEGFGVLLSPWGFLVHL